jgi:hypothetical protein
MPTDPKYVRLAPHRADRTITDIAGGSGWTISGGDVQPFPTRKDAARFVRQRLAQGILEPASKAELDEIKKADAKFKKLHEEHGTQEGMLQDLVDDIRGQQADAVEEEENDDALARAD